MAKGKLPIAWRHDPDRHAFATLLVRLESKAEKSSHRIITVTARRRRVRSSEPFDQNAQQSTLGGSLVEHRRPDAGALLHQSVASGFSRHFKRLLGQITTVAAALPPSWRRKD
jgi:hypothetical protein